MSKKVWLIVGIAVLVVALALVYTNYSRQVKELEQLDDRLKKAEALLPQVTRERQDLEDRLAQAQSLFAANQAKFPESVDSIQYSDDLFEIADDCNVDITSLSLSKPTDKKVGALTYYVSSVSMGIQGSVDDVLKFIGALRTGNGFTLPWSAEVKTIYLRESGTTIALDIYSYKG